MCLAAQLSDCVHCACGAATQEKMKAKKEAERAKKEAEDEERRRLDEARRLEQARKAAEQAAADRKKQEEELALRAKQQVQARQAAQQAAQQQQKAASAKAAQQQLQKGAKQSQAAAANNHVSSAEPVSTAREQQHQQKAAAGSSAPVMVPSGDSALSALQPPTSRPLTGQLSFETTTGDGLSSSSTRSSSSVSGGRGAVAPSDDGDSAASKEVSELSVACHDLGAGYFCYLRQTRQCLCAKLVVPCGISCRWALLTRQPAPRDGEVMILTALGAAAILAPRTTRTCLCCWRQRQQRQPAARGQWSWMLRSAPCALV